MKIQFISVTTIILLLCAGVIYADKSKNGLKQRERMEETLKSLPDSLFEPVEMEDLLDDEVYLKLAHEGWSAREIEGVMNVALKNKGAARLKGGYEAFAKQWRPAYGRRLTDDSMYQFTDTAFTRKMIASISETVPTSDLNTSWPIKIYNPADRMKGVRDPGYFRTVQHNPSSGRIRHIQVHPTDPDKLYVIADGSGIFKTEDCGKHWTCITDAIPDRLNRSSAGGYSIPVDPDKWDHLFAFMDNNSVYETEDGGENWVRVTGATAKSFKKAYAFKDSKGNLKFIGAVPNGSNYMNSELWISEDKGVNWVKVTPDVSLRETTSEGTGLWFQQVYFDTENRDKIYVPGSRSILYFDDGATKGSDGAYHLKKLRFNIVDESGNILEEGLTEFPFEGESPGMMDIDPNNPRKMWYAMGIRNTCETALYYTEDGGANWKVLHNDLKKIGKGKMFGNEVPWGWLGGFGVNYKNPDLMYGCSMSSAKSSDGGRTWTEFSWGTRLKSQVRDADGEYSTQYYNVTNSRHNADNHTIVAQSTGRVFRASDSGILMIDPEINGGEWTNIGGDMGQMLYYNVRVNEFGDQAIVGNTQDIDVQTYRYGRWGHWRGYEGSEASFNPYSNAEYFSGGGGGDLDGISFSSWHTARNFADVRTGSWYMLRTWSGNSIQSTLYRIDDVGRSAIDLFPGINKRVIGFGMARDKGRTTIYVNTADWYFYKSVDGGNTFEMMKVGNVDAKFSNTRFAVDPDNSRYIYLGQNAKVLRWDTEAGSYQTLGTGLPSIGCDRLLFHEGSGDLYFVSYSNGIYILENGSTQWKYWTKGYNPSKFNDCDINYTTQELVLSDYGRGVWVADLQNPADRYFKDGFKLKEYSNVNGRRTIGIDTEWTIPLYHNYKWEVWRNGTKLEIENPYQYLNYPLKKNDRVKLTLSLREAPDVTTESEEFTVADTQTTAIEPRQGNAMYSNGEGRMDIGYMDWFFNDFTVDLWVKPESDGVILANRQREVDPDRKGAKGWMLYVEGGRLKFAYSPRNYFTQPTYETTEPQTLKIEGSSVPMGVWSHVAVSQEREGNIVLYINGEPVATGVRAYPEHTLNNSVCLSLFGDIYEHNTLKGSVDELKIWNKALTAEDLRREMFSTNLPNEEGLVAYYNFNSDNLDEDSEAFSGRKPVSRTRAEVEYRRMSAPVSANYQKSDALGGGKVEFVDGDAKLLDIDAQGVADCTAYVFGYDSERWNNEDDNLDRKYYEPTDAGYLIRTYGTVNPDATASITFHNGKEKTFAKDKIYRLYTADNAGDRTYWKLYDATPERQSDGSLVISDVLLPSLTNKKLLIVSMQPAFELSVSGLNAEGKLEVFDEEADTYPFTLAPVAGKTIPEGGRYSLLSSSSALIAPSSAVSFRNNVASGNFRIEMDSIGDFGKTINASIKGEDDGLIPLPIDIVNRITPRELGNGVAIEKGGLTVGSGSNFSALYGKNTATFMGWVRIDDPNVLTSGRASDGIAPLIFFRGGGGTATGIHLKNGGNLSCHWNDESWSYGITSSLKFTAEDIGKWMHVAMVVRGNSIDFYLNGMKQTVNRANISPSAVTTALMLGQNAEGNTWFTGAFDQVGVWNRALSDDEVRKYMHERVLLNDPGLLSYITMDYFDDNGRLCDLVSDATIKEYGTITKKTLSTAPFKPEQRMALQSADNNLLKITGTYTGELNVFSGSPYNMLSPEDASSYYPLNKEFYGVTLSAANTATAQQTITYSHPSIVEGDNLVLGLRQLGDTSPFANLEAVKTVAPQNGAAVFSVPGNRLQESMELMVFLDTQGAESRRPLIVNRNLKRGIQNGDTLLLDLNSLSEVDLYFEVESANDGDRMLLDVLDPNIISVKDKEIDLYGVKGEVAIPVTINGAQLPDRFGLNAATINFVGPDVEPITFYIGLKPYVKLTLENGTDATHFTATSLYPTLDVRAELEYGYLTEDVKLAFTPPSLGISMDAANGKLFGNNEVKVGDMNYEKSGSENGLEDGWNMYGNPYLSNVNLTKSQNVKYDESKLTRFLFHTLPGTDNLIAFDMTEYDERHSVMPFQAYFIQAMAEDASLTVTPTAREIAATKKSIDYYNMSEVATLRLSLLDGDREIDRTAIKWNENATADYLLNEDAPKIMSRNSATPAIYTMSEPPAGDPGDIFSPSVTKAAPVALSINELNVSNKTVPLYIEGGESEGKLSLKVSGLSGLNNTDKLYLINQTEDTSEELKEGEVYEINPDNSYAISYNYETGVDKIEGDTPEYRIYTEPGKCIVKGLRGNADVSIYTIGGLMVAREKTKEPSATFTLEGNVYIVRILENGREFTSKIIVK